MALGRFFATLPFLALTFTALAKADTPDLKTGMDVKEAKTLDVNGVKIENFTGEVTINSKGTGNMVQVSLKGPDAWLKEVIVTKDHKSEKGNLYITFEDGAPILDDRHKLDLTIDMPSKMPLDLTLVGGKGVIGSREANNTTVNLNGFGDIQLASVKDLKSRIDGSGEITIMDIQGNAALAIRGDGKYTVQKGKIPHLEASISGTGVIHVKADVQDADLKSEGAGMMELATVTGQLDQSMNGAGSISIAKVRGSFKNNATGGSTRLKMDCGKKKRK